MINSDQQECLGEALQDLREDAVMLQSVLLNAKAPVEQLTLDCLLRLSDYLNQHIQDVEMLVGNQNAQKKTR